MDSIHSTAGGVIPVMVDEGWGSSTR